jgi:uncharacterized protein YdeI (YjbR/CyaY-like superfamily)
MLSNDHFRDEMDLIHRILQKTGLVPVIKWGAAVYTYKGKNIVSAGAFKNHCTLWFYNGVFLQDKHKVLVNAQEGKTKALRQWSFNNIDQINEALILTYIKEAVDNEEQGKVHKPQKSPQSEIPKILLEAFQQHHDIKAFFYTLAIYKQKDYIEYLNAAKRPETQERRLQKILPMIIQGIGLHDKYKK